MILTGKARIAGVMGWPVAHSRSPRLHGFWLERYGIDGAYIPFAIRPEDAEAALRALPKLGFAGTNVTVPHKEAVLRAVDEVDPGRTPMHSASWSTCALRRPAGRRQRARR